MPGPFAGFDVCNMLRSSQTTSMVLGTGARSVANVGWTWESLELVRSRTKNPDPRRESR